MTRTNKMRRNAAPMARTGMQGFLFMLLLVVGVGLAAGSEARAGVVQVAAGATHSMALMDDGTVRAWGSNNNTVPGMAAFSTTCTPTPVPGVNGATAIAAGGRDYEGGHTVALLNDGTVMAWGMNDYGQLGVTDSSSYPFLLTPRSIPELTNVKAVAAGDAHTVALLNDGTVRAWGDNSRGQVGGTEYIYSTPTPVPGLAGVIAIAAGDLHTVALLNDGTVVEWGGTPTPVPGLANVKAIAAGENHTVALLNNGTVYAWGYNHYGQLGDGTSGFDYKTPVAVLGLTGVTAIAAGEYHTVALLNDGTLRAWGRNGSNQLGDGTTTNRLTPVAIPGITGVTAIAAGSAHTMTLLNDGTVRAWGQNIACQLGDVYPSRLYPIPVQNLSNVSATDAGDNHTVTLLNDGTVRAWGDNGYGQLGDGTTTNRFTPVAVPGLTGVRAIAGSTHTVALLNDGTVRAWGQNNFGQLGDGTSDNIRISPVPVPGLAGVRTIAAGGDHTVALLNDGTLRAWGSNSVGQLGDGTTTRRTTPGPVPGLAGVRAIAAGTYHTVALLNDGTVRAWGHNRYGQLGDGTTTQRATPIPVPGLSGVKAVAAGGLSSLALLNDGTVMAWGAGTTTSPLSPTQVPGLSGVKAIAAGVISALALLNDDTVMTWGNGSEVQLTPVLVPGLTGVKAIAAGGSHAVAILNDGTVRAWGDNPYGQLGIGITSFRPIVEPVLCPLTVTENGGGRAILQPANAISWGADTGHAAYPLGSVVTLAATPGSCSAFAGWAGDCTGTGDCVLSMDRARNVTAEFTILPETLTATYYRDADGDGFGDPAAPVAGCPDGPEPGYAANSTDCHDAATGAHPGGVEICGDGIDNDCNGFVDREDGSCAAHIHYFPAIKDDNAAGWANYLTVQATDPVAMDVIVRVHDVWGGLAGVHTYSDTAPNADAPAIAPYARVAQRPSMVAGTLAVPLPVEGSMTVETSVPAIATTNTISNSFEGFSIVESAKPRSVHNFPKAFDGPNNYQVYVLVQNIHDIPINVTAELFGKNAASPGHGAKKTFFLPARGSLKFRPSDVAGGIDFSGSVVVSSDGAAPGDGLGPAIPSMCRYELGKEAMTVYESTVEQPALYFPTVRDGKFGGTMDFQNYLSVVNPNTADATVEAILHTNAGVRKASTGPVVIPGGGKITWRPSMILGTVTAPIDFEGSVMVTTTIAVVGQTNTMYPGNNTYQCDAFDLFESAMPNTTLFFPKAFDNIAADGHLYDNFVYVQNPDATAKNITIEQFNNNGSANGVRTVPLAANATYVYRPKDLVTDGTGTFRGSVRVTETGGGKIAGAIKYDLHQGATSTTPVDAMTLYRSMGQ